MVGTFSFHMLESTPCQLKVTPIPKAVVQCMEFDSRIGYESTAVLLSKLLVRDLRVDRTAIKLDKHNPIIMAHMLNSTGRGKHTMNPDFVDTMRPGIDYDYTFYLVEVV